eukprot:COSAG02_NODE_11935_length_1628_cov_635.321125_2_plen_144_part_00
MRIGQKIKNGLRLGAKVVGGALTAGAIGYLGYKGYEHKGRLDKVKSDNLLAQSFESMSPAQLDAFISQGQQDLGANYGQLAAPPPPPVPVPIGQQFIAGPTDGNPSFGVKVEKFFQKGVNVGQGIQTGEQAVSKVKNFFGYGG